MRTDSYDSRHNDGCDFEEQLVMPEIEDFWAERSLDELAAAQGVEVVECIEVLRDGTISDEEAEAFLSALGL